MSSMRQREPQFNVRLPQELKDAIVDAAAKNNRSINSEIIFRLEQSFRTVESVVIDSGEGVTKTGPVQISAEDWAVLARIVSKSGS